MTRHKFDFALGVSAPLRDALPLPPSQLLVDHRQSWEMMMARLLEYAWSQPMHLNRPTSPPILVCSAQATGLADETGSFHPLRQDSSNNSPSHNLHNFHCLVWAHHSSHVNNDSPPHLRCNQNHCNIRKSNSKSLDTAIPPFQTPAFCDFLQVDRRG